MNIDVIKITNIVFGLLALIAKYGPDFIVGVWNIIADLKLAFKSATAGRPLTADEQAQYDDALAKGEKTLADAMEKADAEDKLLEENKTNDGA